MSQEPTTQSEHQPGRTHNATGRVVLKIVAPLLVIMAGVAIATALIKNKPQMEPRKAEPYLPAVRVQIVKKAPYRLKVQTHGTVAAHTRTIVTSEVGGRVVMTTPGFAAGAFVEPAALAPGEQPAPKDERGLLIRIFDEDYRNALAQAEATHAQATAGESSAAAARQQAEAGVNQTKAALLAAAARVSEAHATQEQVSSGLASAQAALVREEAEVRLARAEWERYGKGEPDPLVLRQPQLAQARAALASAQAAISSAAAMLASAEAGEAAAHGNLEAAHAAVTSAEAGETAALANSLAAQARVAAAKLDLARTAVRVPFSCRIVQTHVELGGRVSPGAPIATIDAIDAAEIRLPVTFDDYAELGISYGPGADKAAGFGEAKGPAVTLSAEIGGSQVTWSGRVVRVEGELDQRNRVAWLVARVEQPYAPAPGRAPLMPGLFVNAEIDGGEIPGTVVIPRTALREGGHVYLVVARNGADVLETRAVKVLRVAGDEVVIGGGVANGERICLSSPRLAKNGLPVKVAEETRNSERGTGN